MEMVKGYLKSDVVSFCVAFQVAFYARIQLYHCLWRGAAIASGNGRQFMLARKADLPSVTAEADGCGAECRLVFILGQHVSATEAQEMSLGILISSMAAAGGCDSGIAVRCRAVRQRWPEVQRGLRRRGWCCQK